MNSILHTNHPHKRPRCAEGRINIIASGSRKEAGCIILIKQIVHIQLCRNGRIADFLAVTGHEVYGDEAGVGILIVARISAALEIESTAKLNAFEVASLDFVGAPQIARIPGDIGQSVANIASSKKIAGRDKRIARNTLRSADIDIRPVRQHVPSWQDFTLDVDFRPTAADFANGNGTTRPISAVVGQIGVADCDICLGQVVIADGATQFAIEELELQAAFVLRRTGRIEDFANATANKCFALIGAEAFRVIGVQAQPFFRIPQNAYARGDRVLDLGRNRG